MALHIPNTRDHTEAWVSASPLKGRRKSVGVRIPNSRRHTEAWESVHVIVRLLVGCQSFILSSHEWRNDMNPAFISTIMAPNFEIKEINSGTRRSIPIPNQNIS